MTRKLHQAEIIPRGASWLFYHGKQTSAMSLAWHIVMKRSPCRGSIFSDLNTILITALFQRLHFGSVYSADKVASLLAQDKRMSNTRTAQLRVGECAPSLYPTRYLSSVTHCEFKQITNSNDLGWTNCHAGR